MTDAPTGSAPAGTPAAPPAAGSNPTTPPPDGGAPPVTPPVAPPAESWTASFTNPETKGFAELRGWKSPEQAVDSFRNLEKLQGVPPERLLKLPEHADDKAGWGEVHKRLGFAAPEKADDYGFGTIEGINADFVGPVQESLHKLGVPKDMAHKAMAEVARITGELEAAAESARTTAFGGDLAKLKTEWGGNFDNLVELGKRAASEYAPKAGLEVADMDAIRDAIGQAKFNKLWAGIGSTTGEASFHEGGGGSTPAAMTPDAARLRLQQLGQDKEWFARYEKGGVREQQEYKQLRDVLANATLNAA